MHSRRFLIPGVVVLAALVLGAVVAVAATRSGGDEPRYRLDVSLPEVTAENRTPVGGAVCPSGGRVADGQAPPLAKTEYAPAGTRTSSVLVAPGQLVPFKFLLTAAANAPLGGTIDFQAAWDRGGQRDAGLDGDSQVLCAFVDPSDPSSRDDEQPATVTWAEAPPTGNNIVANFSVQGVDPADRVVMEAWVVSRTAIPSSSGSLGVTLTATDPDNEVKLGRDKLPFRLEYFDRVETAELQLTVTDGEKAARQPNALNYVITITNPGQDAIAPLARLDDFLDKQTKLAGPVAIDDKQGSKTTCLDSADGFTCTLGFVNPGEKIVITAPVTLLPGVERRYPEDTGPCAEKLVDVCNRVVLTWKQSDSSDGRVTVEEPTDVPNDTALTITKLLNAPAPFAYPGQRVTFTYAVTNATANVNYNQLKVSDSSCTQIDFKGGDSNNNSRLEPGESFRYECTIDRMEQGLTVSRASVDALLDTGAPVSANTVTQIKLIAPKLAVKTGADPSDSQLLRVTVSNVGDADFTDVSVWAAGCSDVTPPSKGTDRIEPGKSVVFTCRVDNPSQPPKIRAYALDPLAQASSTVPEIAKQ